MIWKWNGICFVFQSTFPKTIWVIIVCAFWPCLYLPRQGKEGDCVCIHYRVYSSLRDFYRSLGNNNNRSYFIGGFLKDDILACVET